MQSISDACATLAAALSTVPDVTVRPAVSTSTPRPGDGWVEVIRVRPAGFGDQAEVTLTVPVVLAQSYPAASARFREVAWPLVAAATEALPCTADVQPQTITLDSGGVAYAAVLTITTEV